MASITTSAMDCFSRGSLAFRALAFSFIGFISYTIFNSLLLRWKSRSYSHAPTPPTTPWWDIFGVTVPMALSKSLDEDRLLEYIKEMQDDTETAQGGKKVNTYEMTLLGRRTFMTMDVKNVQAVLAHQFQDFGLGEDRIGSFLPMLGVGIFASDGKSWEHSRLMLRPSFARNRVEDLDLEEKHGRNLLRAFPPADSEGWTPEFDIQPLFYRLTMDSSTEFFFGESASSLLAEQDSLESRFVGAFDRGQHYVGHRTSLGPYYWMMNNKQFKADCKTVHEWTDACVDRALKRYNDRQKGIEKGDGGESGEYIFLDELIAQTQDRVALRSQLLNVLIAGRDTTAGLLSWVFLHLSRRPELFQQLRNTILETFGTYEDPRDITFATLKSCKPLQNLLKEALRLHPGVPTNIRQALKDTSLPTGGGPAADQPIFVPKGSQIFYTVYWMHRDKSYWGEDADEFKPERWEKIKPGWEYLPFNGGPRICLGQMFALTSAGYAVVRMLQRFDDVRTSEFGDLRVHVSLTAHSANGVHLSLHRTEAK